jgi:hypothetical protein
MTAEDYWRSFLPVGTATNINYGTTLASATTIAPVKYVTNVSGTTEITTITLPYTDFSGTICLVPTGIWTLNTGGNIAIAATAVVSKAMYLTYNPVTSKWYPSYLS